MHINITIIIISIIFGIFYAIIYYDKYLLTNHTLRDNDNKIFKITSDNSKYIIIGRVQLSFLLKLTHVLTFIAVFISTFYWDVNPIFSLSFIIIELFTNNLNKIAMDISKIKIDLEKKLPDIELQGNK